MADNINMHSFNDNTIMGFTINFILVVSINTFTGWLSLVSIVLLILFIIVLLVFQYLNSYFLADGIMLI